MNEDVRRSRVAVSRRRALGIGGALSLGGLLAACGGGGSDGSAGATPSTSTGATATSTGATASTTAGTDVLTRLDAAGTCSLAKEETQGPYWFDVDSIRSDIREQRPGTAFTLGLRVQDVSACGGGGTAVPVANCVVEIWHCDAGGSYSGFESGGGGAGGGGAGGGGGGSGGTSNGSYSAGDQEATVSDDGTYLRGAQVADSKGVVQFTTIFPGWYRGRTTHIHLKVHVNKKTVLTTQLYVEDQLATEVYTSAPYNERTGRDTFNSGDSIFDASGILAVSKNKTGYLGVLNLGVDV